MDWKIYIYCTLTNVFKFNHNKLLQKFESPDSVAYLAFTFMSVLSSPMLFASDSALLQPIVLMTLSSIKKFFSLEYNRRPTAYSLTFPYTSSALFFQHRVFARNLLRGNRKWNTFRILFWCLAWSLNFGHTSKKSTHYLLDYGDFEITPIINKCNKHEIIPIRNKYILGCSAVSNDRLSTWVVYCMTQLCFYFHLGCRLMVISG